MNDAFLILAIGKMKNLFKELSLIDDELLSLISLKDAIEKGESIRLTTKWFDVCGLELDDIQAIINSKKKTRDELNNSIIFIIKDSLK